MEHAIKKISFIVRQPSSGPRPPHCWGFEITLRHTTLGGTPLDEWSTRRRSLYLTSHNTHKRQTSMPLAEFEPAIPVSQTRLRTSGCQDRPYILCALVTIFEDADIQPSTCTRRVHTIMKASFQTLLWNKNHSSSQLFTLPRGVHFFLRDDSSLSYQEICSRFIEPELSLPCSHELATLWTRWSYSIP
jgi:hypothetical protein